MTLGPKGRNVVLDKKYRVSTITNDGVTIARDIELEDPSRTWARSSSRKSPPRPTTSPVTARRPPSSSPMRWSATAFGSVTAGANPMQVKGGIEKAVGAVDEIKRVARPSRRAQIAAVASISAADPEVGEVIAEVMDKVGKDGVITVEEGQSLGLEQEYTEGMQFDRGYISAYFVTNPDRMEAVLEDPLILISDKKISSVQDILPALEKVVSVGKPVLIIAEDIDGEALATLVVNKLRGTVQVLAVKAPASATAARRCSAISPSSPAARSSARRSAASSTRSPPRISARRGASSPRRTTRRSSTAPAGPRTSRPGWPRSRPRSRTPPRTTTRRNSRSVSPSSPAVSP